MLTQEEEQNLKIKVNEPYKHTVKNNIKYSGAREVVKWFKAAGLHDKLIPLPGKYGGDNKRKRRLLSFIFNVYMRKALERTFREKRYTLIVPHGVIAYPLELVGEGKLNTLTLNGNKFIFKTDTEANFVLKTRTTQRKKGSVYKANIVAKNALRFYYRRFLASKNYKPYELKEIVERK